MWIDGIYENLKWIFFLGEMVYINWKFKRLFKVGEDCILLMLDNFKWDLILCFVKNFFLCEIKII